MKNMILVLLGGPGSGKGTQAKRLSETYSLEHVSTGELFREHIAAQSELGILAKAIIDRGHLVPDDITVDMLRAHLENRLGSAGFIFDGFPRTEPQAEALEKLLAEEDLQLDAVLYIVVSDEEIVNRLSKRRICGECQTPFHEEHNPFRTCPFDKCQGEFIHRRDDDKPETVRARIRTYYSTTAPLIELYKNKSLLIEIDGEGDVDTVASLAAAAVDNLSSEQ